MARLLGGRRGFTMVEVMATVTLIANLGGASSFVNIKSEAQQQVCLQHLQVIGQTFLMEDVRGRPLPKACFFPKSAGQTNSLPKVMGGKVQHLAWLCPCSPVKLREHKITYVYNSKHAGKQMTAIPRPNETWLLADMCLVSSKLPAPHHGGANILFADGQARWIPKDKLPKLK